MIYSYSECTTHHFMFALPKEINPTNFDCFSVEYIHDLDKYSLKS